MPVRKPVKKAARPPIRTLYGPPITMHQARGPCGNEEDCRLGAQAY